MTQIIKILACIALIVSIAWLVSSPSFEPALALVTSMLTLISAFVVEKRSKRLAKQHQSVSNSSMGIQAGGNVNIGDVSNDKHAK